MVWILGKNRSLVSFVGVWILSIVGSAYGFTCAWAPRDSRRHGAHISPVIHRDSQVSTESTSVPDKHQTEEPVEEEVEDPTTTFIPHPPTTHSAIFRISYDGARFYGWSSSNDDSGNNNKKPKRLRHGSQRRKSRLQAPLGTIRSVQGVLQQQLAKVYGNVAVSQIVVEGCSRTDKGVHAMGNMALFYGIQTQDNNETDDDFTTNNSYHYLPLPMKGDLPRLAFALNRMLPPDVRIVGIAPTPNNTDAVFHPSLSARSKTYVYHLACGGSGIVDPPSRHWVWHAANGKDLDLLQIEQACQLLQGTHDFAAFQGAPRGQTDKDKRQTSSTICTLYSVRLEPSSRQPSSSAHPLVPMPTANYYTVTIQGDRFLYKMVRFLVGALVDIGLGHKDLEDLQQALVVPMERDKTTNDNNNNNNNNNSKVFTTCAPAHGLILQGVDYNDNHDDNQEANATFFDWQPLRN